jgi:hypothetical protein
LDFHWNNRDASKCQKYVPFCKFLGDKMKRTLVFITGIMLALGIAFSLMGFSHNNFSMLILGGFFVGFWGLALYQLSKV